ncbi:MAG TPA: M24 family metallopeptidase [Isosphaeraceae bacterium]|nr:M24 family metallopeptidase [Isosphaeraceae bacterium]
MSSEIHLGTLTLPIPDDLDLDIELASGLDRVRHTAEDRPSPSEASLPALTDPAADPHVDPALAARRADVDEKHRRVREILDAENLDALVLSRADSVAWFSCGGETGQLMCSEASSALLYINRNSRAVVCDNVQSARLFEEELAGLGFQLKERPWYDDPSVVIAELGRNKRVGTDRPGCCKSNLLDMREALASVRFPLTKHERQKFRELGRALTLAIEATCRNFAPGETEADVAGHLAHRLFREGVVPVDLRVASDDRLARYRQPTFKAAEIHRSAIISAVGRRHGLCASATRIVSIGKVDKDFQHAHNLAAMVDATCIFFSRPGETVQGAFRRAKRIYEKFDHADEWTLDYQGFVVGYQPRETLLKPESPMDLRHGMPLCWSPSVGAARSEDTVVVDERGYEVVTEAQRWPKLEISVKGYPVQRPGILER